MKILRIKNMVCPRCIMVIEKTMEELGFELNDVDLGIIEFHEPITLEDRNKIEKVIKPLGFEILSDRKSTLVERIKTQIIELVSKDVNDLTITLSEYLSSKLQVEYHTLSQLFSSKNRKLLSNTTFCKKLKR